MLRSHNRKFIAGIDLGGTNMQIGIIDAQNQIVGREARKTEAAEGYRKVLRRIADGVNAACRKAGADAAQLAAVGIVAPGAIDIPNGVVLDAPNLKWKNLPLRDLLEQEFRCRVVVDNDVNGAVWGEFNLGAGRNVSRDMPAPKKRERRRGIRRRSANLPPAAASRRMTPITTQARSTAAICDQRESLLGVWLGTGVGGGLVINGQLFYGAFFTAGEIGQTVLFPRGEPGRLTVEDFCSRTGMSRTVAALVRRYPNSILCEGDGGRAPQIIGSKALAKAYKSKDSLAMKVVNEAADLLGIAVANWVTVLALDTVIIGGGVTEALGASFLKRVRNSFRQFVFPDRCRKCRLLMTELRDDAGLLGAALLARQHGGRGA
jgi:glucokinase